MSTYSERQRMIRLWRDMTFLARQAHGLPPRAEAEVEAVANEEAQPLGPQPLRPPTLAYKGEAVGNAEIQQHAGMSFMQACPTPTSGIVLNANLPVYGIKPLRPPTIDWTQR